MVNSPENCWIFTIRDINYGNRLQNFALTRLLSNYGFKVCSINTEKNPSRFFIFCKNIFKRTYSFITENMSSVGRLNYRRRQRFESFDRHCIGYCPVFVSPQGGMSTQIRDSDCFVLGSDQVWNDQWVSPAILRLRLGSAFPCGHIISYAASFGVDHVKPESETIFAQLLPRISAIAVREDRGAELVQELSGRQSTVVLDPTLMLTADQWRSIIPGDFVSEDEKYVLTYFLGKPSPEQEYVIQQYAKAHGCKVRRMLDLDDPSTYVAGPREFVELFSKAQYVFTDSYHACCFSILFNKQFKVFNRAGFSGKTSMNSRMTTLFRLFELNDLMGDDTKLETVDYSRVNALLEQHRRESRAWLEQALTKIGAIA